MREKATDNKRNKSKGRGIWGGGNKPKCKGKGGIEKEDYIHEIPDRTKRNEK